MEKNVSCRSLAGLIDFVNKKHLPVEILLKDIPYNLEYLQDKNERIEWPVYCRILKNLRLHFEEKDFIEFGQSWVKSKYFKPWAGLTRLLFNLGKSLPFTQNLLNAIGKQFFAGINFRLEKIGADGFKVILTMEDGYEFCPEHFTIVKGSLSVIPTIWGDSQSSVVMKGIERGATYEVNEIKKLGKSTWLYKKIFWVFTAKSALNEIREAHQTLILRYQELQKAQSELDKLPQQLIELRYKERQRIASELHDEIGSNLSSMALTSHILTDKLQGDPKYLKRLSDLENLATTSAESIRDIVWFINPQNDSFEKLINKMRLTTTQMLGDIKFNFKTNAMENIDSNIAIEVRRNLFLIYKEILNNIIRHAHARYVQVDLQKDKNSFVLKVKDDGRGFNAALKMGNGLRNFQMRAKAINGSVTINSHINKGTEILVNGRIP